MGDGIQINRVAERFSSHTLSHQQAAWRRPSGQTAALREKLIAAMAEVVADGGDPRLA
jgi:ribosomal protein L32E